MNYRHHFHAGNFADVVKHALLVHLALGMQRKPKGCLFLDTHAGRGEYDLSLAGKGDTLARQPEHPGGIGRIWARDDLPGPLAAYRDLVREFDRARGGGGAEGPRFYPGSPWILALLARPQDRMALCERHPEDCEALRMSLGARRRVSIQETDGYGAVSAFLPPPERRALVLIDPPFEDAKEGSRIAASLEDGLKRLPAGTYAVWYPLTERAGIDGMFDQFRTIGLPPTIAIEAVIDPQAPKMRGCGLMVVNPPWRFEDEIMGSVLWLAEALAVGKGAGASSFWLVPE